MAVKTKDVTVNLSEFTTEGHKISGNKKTAIRIDGLTQAQAETLTYEIVGNNLEITTSDSKKLVVTNYTGIKYIKTDYNKSGKKETYNLYDLISNNAITNTADVLYNNKKKAFVGTNYNDTFTSKSDNETFTGGLGKNTYNFTKTAGGNDVINLTNKENLILNLSDIDKSEITLKYVNKNKDLMLYIDENNSITLKNFVTKNVVGTGSITLNTQDKSGIILKDEYIKKTITTASSYTGTRLNDYIDAKSAPEKLDRKEKHVNLVFKGGAGDDKIESSNFADSITGGSGKNEIIYTSLTQLAGDKITLTKGENLTIDVTGIAGATASYEVSGKDLIVTVKEGETTESFKILNFGTKDVTNNATKTVANTSSVELLLKDGAETKTIDLRTTLLDKLKITKNYTGTFHADNISAEDYNLYTDKKKTNVDYVNLNKKGLTINGGDGADKIVGSRYSDTIKAGTGTGDYIEGGTGNDKLYASTTANSNTTFSFKAGDGKDTVYSGKGEDTLKFEGISIADITLNQGTGKNNKDLIVSYNHNAEGVAQDSVTIKDYYKVDKKGKSLNTIKYIQIDGSQKIDIEQLIGKEMISSSNSTINGTSGDDLIIATGEQSIRGNGGNDIVYASNNGVCNITLGDGDDIIYAPTAVVSFQSNYDTGNGNNTVYLGDNHVVYLQLGSGDDTVYLGNDLSAIHFVKQSNQNGGNDTIYWGGSTAPMLRFEDGSGYKLSDLSFTKNNENDDLVIRYGENNSVTLKDYYKAGNEGMAELRLFVKDEEGTSVVSPEIGNAIETNGGVKIQLSGVEGTDGNDYIVGTDENDTITAGNGNDLIMPNGGNDIINLGKGDDYLMAGDGNKEITAVSGNNKIYLGTGNNTVYAGTDSDLIISGSGENTIEFASDDNGNDYYTYNNGNDTLVFKGDSLSDLKIDTSGDEIVLTRGSKKTVTINNLDSLKTGLTIKDKNNDTSTLFDLNTTTGSATSSEAQNLVTGKGNDTIYTGLSNDTIYVGSGTNTINLVVATIGNNNTYTYNGGSDTFVLDSENLNGVTFLKNKNDLVIGYNGDLANNTLTVSGYFEKTAMSENISFESKSATLTLKKLIDDKGYSEIMRCEDGNHTINASGATNAVTIEGCEEADKITGSDHDDSINGNGGGDTLKGGAGNDTYIIDSSAYGKGQDVIKDISGDSDKLLLGAGENEANVFFDIALKKDGDENVIMNGLNATYTTGDDLYIIKDKNYTWDNAKTSNGVKIENYFTTGKIEVIRNSDNTADIFDSRHFDAIAQAVANYLNKIGKSSVSDVMETGTEEQKTAIMNYYKPIVSNTYIYGTSGDDLIIATGNKSIKGNGGNDIVYASNNGICNITLGDGDDIIYAPTATIEYQSTYNTGNGNNTVYLSDNHTVYLYLGIGDDTVYLGNRYSTIHLISMSNNIGGHDTIYWGGSTSPSIYFDDGNTLTSNGYKLSDLSFTKNNESDDLIIRYGEDNSVTLKDYYKAGNEDMAELRLSVEKAEDSGTDWIEIGNAIKANGEQIYGTENNDTYELSVSNDYNVSIYDSAGDDNIIFTTDTGKLLDAESQKQIHVLFDVQSDYDGSSAFTGDIQFVDNDNLALYKAGSSYNALTVKENAVETIKTNDNYQLTSANISSLAESVASWLSTYNEGAFSSVSDVLSSGTGDDITALIAQFDTNANWQLSYI